MRLIPQEIRRERVVIGEAIGDGYFATVLRGEYQPDSGHPIVVAIKRLRPTSNGHSDRVLLLQEAAVMAGLDHANIVKLIGVVTVGDPCLIVLEFCEKELTVHLQSRSFRYSELIGIATDCADGMAYLTSKKIVHRDLAARNVMIDRFGRAKVSDYVMSRVIESKAYYRSHNRMMPIRWSSPEALENSVFNEDSDIWSFGVLLYEIATRGGEPYEGLSDRKVWDDVLAGHRLSLPLDFPPFLNSLMTSCYQRPDDRPRFAEISKLLNLHLSTIKQQLDTDPSYQPAHRLVVKKPPKSNYAGVQLLTVRPDPLVVPGPVPSLSVPSTPKGHRVSEV